MTLLTADLIMKSQTTLLRGIEMKKRIAILLCVLMLFSSTFVLVSCKDDSFDKKGYDLSLPVLGEDGWYLVFQDDFDGDALNENIQKQSFVVRWLWSHGVAAKQWRMANGYDNTHWFYDPVVFETVRSSGWPDE